MKVVTQSYSFCWTSYDLSLTYGLLSYLWITNLCILKLDKETKESRCPYSSPIVTKSHGFYLGSSW